MSGCLVAAMGDWMEDECLGLWGYLVALTDALKSELVAHSPALAGLLGMSQAGATAVSDGQEGRERNPWIKARPRLDLLGMRNFPTRSRQLARALAALVGRRENRRMRRSLLTLGQRWQRS